MIAAIYVALSHLQNMLLPGSASAMIQVRVAEAMSVLAFFTPAAIPGLAIGCLLFNMTSGMALPLDFFIGTAATVLATGGMYALRKFPAVGFVLPAVFNGFLVGWELSVYIGGGFWLNCGCVALGELIALALGIPLYFSLKKLKW
jgi:uncharacterized membrane protein